MAYYLITAYLLTATLCFIVTCFFIFHLWLISKQYTTIEYCEKRSENEAGFKLSPYNLGPLRNYKTVLGTNIILWFIPISKLLFILTLFLAPDLYGEGLVFEIRDDLKKERVNIWQLILIIIYIINCFHYSLNLSLLTSFSQI